jgi:hypothetical protein
MTVQARLDISNIPFLRAGPALMIDDAVIAQDAGRSGDMVPYTLLAYNPTTQKWVPFTDETAVDGTQYPKGILVNRTLEEADIQAGDISNVGVYVGRMIVDEDQLVIENSKTLDTIVNIPAGYNTSVKDLLKQIDIYTEATIDVDGFENS